MRVVRAAGLRVRDFEAVRLRDGDADVLRERVRDFDAVLARGFDAVLARGFDVALAWVEAAGVAAFGASAGFVSVCLVAVSVAMLAPRSRVRLDCC